MRLITTGVKYVLAFVLALSLGSGALAAQEDQTKATKRKAITVTGCLQKGDEAGEYAITSDDGKRYGLHSKAVDLSKHVGHKVTVTGTKMHEANEEKKEQEKKEAGGTEYADLHVTDVKHISESCK
jgi:hypothetical protein